MGGWGEGGWKVVWLAPESKSNKVGKKLNILNKKKLIFCALQFLKIEKINREFTIESL